MRSAVPVRFSLGALLLVVTFLAVALGLGVRFSMHGWIASLELVVVLLGACSLLRVTRVAGIHVYRPTLGEFLFLLGIGAYLHWAALPAVMSGPHPRRSPPAVAAPPAATTPAASEGAGEAPVPQDPARERE